MIEFLWPCHVHLEPFSKLLVKISRNEEMQELSTSISPGPPATPAADPSNLKSSPAISQVVKYNENNL